METQNQNFVVGTVIILFYDYRNKLFDGRLISLLIVTSLDMLYVTPSPSVAPTCLSYRIEQKRLHLSSKSRRYG